MKTATIPSIRVEPAFRDRAEAVLQRNETLSSFVETALAEAIERRTMQRDFIARGLASLEESERADTWHAAAEVHKELAERLGIKGKKGKA